MSTTLLAIETATDTCSVALQLGETQQQLISREPRQHAQQVLPMVQQLLAEHGLTLAQVDAIAMSQGPGSFTGVRIGTAVVQGLAFGHDIPVAPVSTLQTLAQGIYVEQAATDIVVAFDARMQEVYWGQYTFDAQRHIMMPQVADQVSPPQHVKVLGNPLALCGAGSGFSAYAVLQQDLSLTSVYPDAYPQARHMLVIAQDLLTQGQVVAAASASPVYCRKEVVQQA